MKYYLLIYLTFNIGCSSAQNKYLTDVPTDSLKKYSYSFLGFSSTNIGQSAGGTCFFIRDNHKTFLITAEHVVSGCDDNNKKIPGFPEILNVLTKDLRGNPLNVININIKQIIDTTPCVRDVTRPDIIVMEVTAPDSIINQVYSVEHFIMPPFRKLGSIVMYGFPNLAYTKNQVEFGYWESEYFEMVGNETEIITHTKYDSPKATDSVNFFMYNQNTTIDSTLKGFSGSPIFVKDLQTNQWRIAGLFAAYGINNINGKRYILAPKFDTIINEVYRKSN